MTEPSLLLLIPAYNEARRIEPVLRDYGRYFQEHYRGKFQLVVVLNGCRDNTLEVVRRVAVDFPAISTLEFADPIGKGGALIEGLKLAPLADLIGYVDADGATPPQAFHDLVKRAGEADCVIGSRWLPGSVLHVEQSGRRRFASRVFHLIVELLFGMHIRDTQCGAKVMHRKAVEAIHSSLRIADMAFDINLLYSLKHAGYRVLEVPTEWTDKIGSKVTLFRTSLTMFLSVIRIRLIYSPFYRWLRPLRPLETWIYRKLRAPQPLPGPPGEGSNSKTNW
ncbi:MAG TPA: glycosyltransferase [Candidatus Paceibacterota bacterium]|nr:glycosyltransferase [Candidatus Paceibacterota bacterium]